MLARSNDSDIVSNERTQWRHQNRSFHRNNIPTNLALKALSTKKQCIRQHAFRYAQLSKQKRKNMWKIMVYHEKNQQIFLNSTI